MKIYKHLRKDWYKYGLETIVVVVGVLIAFALNDWRDGRKQRTNEIELLKDLAFDIKTTIVQFEQRYVANKKFHETQNNFILANLKEQEVDYNVYEILSLGDYRPLNTNISSLEVALQSSTVTIFSSDSLVSMLRKLKVSLGIYEKHTFYLDESWNRRIVPFYEESGMTIQQFAVETEGLEPDVSILERIDTEVLANKLAYHALMYAVWISRQEEILFELEAILTLVESQLD